MAEPHSPTGDAKVEAGPSRRGFVRLAGLLLAAPFVAALASMLERLDATRPTRIVRLGPDFPDAVTFATDAIVIRTPDGHRRVLSARCPHLGCRVTRREGSELVCPCHGSRFALDGTVTRGPAARPLAPLPHTVDPRSGVLLVTLD